MFFEVVLLAILGGGAVYGAFAFGPEDQSVAGEDAGRFNTAEADGDEAQGNQSNTFWQAESLWVGEEGADSVQLTEGSDLGLGGDGDDVIEGGSGDDRLLGEAGNDHLFGGAGHDLLMDGQHDRSGLEEERIRLWINALNDEAMLFLDDDEFLGGSGDDVIHSREGQDLAYGGEGDDLIVAFDLGEIGADGLFGGAGNDRLMGDSHDVMIGGAGADIFEVDVSHNELESGQEGRVSILDFNPDQDQIILHDVKSSAPEFDMTGPRDQELSPEFGSIHASQYGDYVRLDLVHLDGSVSELAELRYTSLPAVESAIAAGSIRVEAA